MHLASDYIYPYKDAGGRRARCRIRIYLPDDDLDAPVVVCSELPNNPGGSITNSAEAIAAGVIGANELPTPLVWIEHWPKETTDVEEMFKLVVFSSYEVVERAPYLGEGMARRRDLEGARLCHRGGVGGREGVGQANQLTHKGFVPPPPKLAFY
jgi:hypothetical protein